jgi:branched-chain amino acid transport system permease protein
MIIIGGLGSILGSFLGAAFIVLLPIVLDNLIVEPNGPARLRAIGKEKLRLRSLPR